MKTYRTHCQTNRCADIRTTSDREIAREQSSHVRTSGHRVRSDVGSQLSESKPCRNNKDPKSLRRASTIQEHSQQVEWIPNQLTENDRSG